MVKGSVGSKGSYLLKGLGCIGHKDMLDSSLRLGRVILTLIIKVDLRYE